MSTTGALFRLARAGWILAREGVIAAIPGEFVSGPPRLAWHIGRLLSRRHLAGVLERIGEMVSAALIRVAKFAK